jgi:hypothetical protein
LAHVDFEQELADQLGGLVANTLAFSVADEGGREELRVLFEEIAEVVKQNADTPEARALLRRSPLPAERAVAANEWLSTSLNTLIEAVNEGDLFERVFTFAMQHAKPDAFAKMSNPDLALVVGQMWFDERSYEEIYHELRVQDLRIGGNQRHVSVDDVVDMCESALGYELAMLVATLADSVESADASLYAALSLLQRRLKYGLDAEAALAFFEAGFADRKVAAILGTAFPDVQNKNQARTAVRASPVVVATLLQPYPAYFRSVLQEIIAA